MRFLSIVILILHLSEQILPTRSTSEKVMLVYKQGATKNLIISIAVFVLFLYFSLFFTLYKLHFLQLFHLTKMMKCIFQKQLIF